MILENNDKNKEDSNKNVIEENWDKIEEGYNDRCFSIERDDDNEEWD